MIINGCNMAMEAINFIVVCIFIVLMLYTRPRNTYNFKLNLHGMILSAIHILLHFGLIYSMTVTGFANTPGFYVLNIAYFIVYYIILTLLFAYIDQLAYSQRNTLTRVSVLSRLGLGFIGYIALICFLLFSGMMYRIDNSGVHFTPFFGVHLFFGAACATIIFIQRLRRGYMIAKIMKNAIVLTVPIDIGILALQFIFNNISFVGLTYVVPFMLFYLLMHSTPFDEMSGAQNRFSFEAHYSSRKNGLENCLVGIITIPQLEALGVSDIDAKAGTTIASICRYIETLAYDMRIYNLDKSSYAFITNTTKQTSIVHIESMIREILSAPVTIDGIQKHYDYKCIMFHEITGLTGYEQFYSFSNYMFDKVKDYTRSLTYHATQKDFEDFNNAEFIEKNLLDIYSKRDLDDPRVICYVQPIYDVNTNTFRTGEALMRLCIDDKLIFPDQFIPIAEKNGYIHTLTCIILNKVCKKIYSLNSKYSFDAISINCSTIEFMDPNLHDELLGIMYDNHVPCSKIRLELTESASVSNYETVRHNMDVLSKAGIKFYLDDFGTGYSNLSRIMSLPFHTVKFDKSLLYKSIENEHIDHLFGSMAETFKNSGLLLLVEGVEDDSQSDYVIGYKFDYIQGYKYARPQDIEKFADFLTPIEIASKKAE